MKITYDYVFVVQYAPKNCRTYLNIYLPIYIFVVLEIGIVLLGDISKHSSRFVTHYPINLSFLMFKLIIEKMKDKVNH